jgi:hypothetical protein
MPRWRDGSNLRFSVHLLLRNARGISRLDYRLGLDPGIRDRQRAVAISWANYFRSLLGSIGIDIPQWLSTDFRTAHKIPGLIESAPHILGVPIVFNLLAFGIVTLITIVLVWGIKESAQFNA